MYCKKNIVFISTKIDLLKTLLFDIEESKKFVWLSSKNEVLKYFNNCPLNTVLISYNHNIIIPKWILDKIEIGYNIHAAPPSYPGRDTHHFAFYNGVSEYGATAHVLTEKVDDGPIVEYRSEKISNIQSPFGLLEIADKKAVEILYELTKKILTNNSPTPMNLSWGKKKYARADFNKMCEIDFKMPLEEIKKRIASFSHPKFNNLYINLHDYKFFLDKK